MRLYQRGAGSKQVRETLCRAFHIAFPPASGLSIDEKELASAAHHRLCQERDILAKAAAWFARESKASPNGFTGS
jgi:hypothetical protein